MAENDRNTDYTQPVDTRTDRAGMRGDGEGRREDPGHSGVYPASDPNAPADAEAQGMAGWGQGERGEAGYDDAGSSELYVEPATDTQVGSEPEGDVAPDRIQGGGTEQPQ